MGKYPNLMYSSSPAFENDHSGQESFDQIQNLFQQLTVNMDHNIWPTADDVDQQSKLDELPSSSSSTPSRKFVERGIDAIDSKGDSLFQSQQQQSVEVESKLDDKNNGMTKATSPKENEKKYSRDFLMSINQVVKNKPFTGEILYPCVLRTHIDPSRVPFRQTRNNNGYYPRFSTYNHDHNNNNSSDGLLGKSPPPLMGLNWWDKPALPISNSFNVHPYNNNRGSILGNPPIERISREPRPPNQRNGEYSYPMTTTFVPKQMPPPSVEVTTADSKTKTPIQKLFHRQMLQISEVQKINEKRTIVPLKVIKP